MQCPPSHRLWRVRYVTWKYILRRADILIRELLLHKYERFIIIVLRISNKTCHVSIVESNFHVSVLSNWIQQVLLNITSHYRITMYFCNFNLWHFKFIFFFSLFNFLYYNIFIIIINSRFINYQTINNFLIYGVIEKKCLLKN